LNVLVFILNENHNKEMIELITRLTSPSGLLVCVEEEEEEEEEERAEKEEAELVSLSPDLLALPPSNLLI